MSKRRKKNDMKVADVVKKEIATMAPASFALVMSTGIISIGSNLLGYALFSHFLFYLNNLQFLSLLAFLIFRVIWSYSAVVKDLATHGKGAGFLTITAACCILGLQYVLLKQNIQVAIALWFTAALLWLFCMYAFFIFAVAKKEKPTQEEGLNGSWLLLAVSTQSLSILTSTLIAHLPFIWPVTIFIAFSGFLLGFVFYLVIITLIFQRLIFSPLPAEEFTPPDWIDMGAAAITTLSGSTLAGIIKTQQLFNELLPVVKTVSLLTWVVATWWIPIVVVLEARRHIVQKSSFTYQAAYWSLVFPLGVYTVCTIRLSEALPFMYLHAIAAGFIVIALLVWLLVFLSMCRHLFGLSREVTNS
jgi:tellurite resistance protein TehA-like permease